MKIKNVRKFELESILQQALFLININNFKMFVFGLNTNYIQQPNFKYISINKENILFPIAEFFEAIVYYNAAVFSPKEMQFHYYYKVLEYFFQKKGLVNHKFFHSNGKRINEEILLYNLLSSSFIEHDIIQITEADLFQDILHIKKLDISKGIIKLFAKELYGYRNKVVHGGDDTRRLPLLITNDYSEYRKTVEWWNNSIEEIAKLCIKHFCYKDKKIEIF